MKQKTKQPLLAIGQVMQDAGMLKMIIGRGLAKYGDKQLLEYQTLSLIGNKGSYVGNAIKHLKKDGMSAAEFLVKFKEYTFNEGAKHGRTLEIADNRTKDRDAEIGKAVRTLAEVTGGSPFQVMAHPMFGRW